MSAKPQRRAAQYLRMSTEQQTFSLEYQSAHNAAYAMEHGFEVVKTYVDAGVSGLRLKGRDGLKSLLADVLAGGGGFSAILVYDVSRWGRFQDLDQGAHYEFLCREAGVQVIYTAEPFSNDGELTSTIVKHVKRAMAAEFSRDLSSRIARAQRGLAYKGFWVNGPPGYGLRRLAVTMAREPRLRMEYGEHKGVRGDRTILVHGPDEEVAIVRRIYSLFVVGGLKIAAIARLLNQEGIPAEDGRWTEHRQWTSHRVRQVLTNEKYAGAFQHGKSKGLLGRRHNRPRSEWVRIANSVEPIVPKATFDAAQRQFRRPKSRNPTDAELLDDLRIVLRDHGRISTALINAHPETHCAEVIRERFGGLINAMKLIEVEPSKRQSAATEQARIRPRGNLRHEPFDEAKAWQGLVDHLARLGRVSSNTIDDDPSLPCAEWYRRRWGSMANIYERLGFTPTDQQRRGFKRPGATPGAPR